MVRRCVNITFTATKTLIFAGGKTQLPYDLAFNEEKLGFIVPCTSFQ